MLAQDDDVGIMCSLLYAHTFAGLKLLEQGEELPAMDFRAACDNGLGTCRKTSCTDEAAETTMDDERWYEDNMTKGLK